MTLLKKVSKMIDFSCMENNQNLELAERLDLCFTLKQNQSET